VAAVGASGFSAATLRLRRPLGLFRAGAGDGDGPTPTVGNGVAADDALGLFFRPRLLGFSIVAVVGLGSTAMLSLARLAAPPLATLSPSDIGFIRCPTLFNAELG